MLKRAISGIILVVVMLFMIDFSDKTYIALWVIVGFATLAEYIGLVLRFGDRLGKRSGLVSAIGGLYIVGSFLLLALGFGLDPQSRMMVITMLTLIWANDVGAYLFGSAFGKHKMCPKISPKKSWEGFAGGVITAVAAALAWQWLFWGKIPTPVELLFVDQWMFFAILGAIAAIGAVVGDLLESAFKRKLQIKDSGKIIPGHGGMLDRFDALLMAAPLVWIYLKFML